VQRGGLLAGAEFAAVVEVHAVGDVGEVELEARASIWVKSSSLQWKQRWVVAA
jgi:hypothetical protein